MAWIILWANGEELTRVELSKALVIGRSAECDLSVRDVLMSRTHCRIEKLGNGWRIVDLNSKNGTRAGWQRVQSHVLRDGDWLRAGRTRITFYTGPFQPGPRPKGKPAERMVRPADPHEALTGTVTDFVLLDEEENAEFSENSLGFPSPQPRPLEPESSMEPAVASLLDALATTVAQSPDVSGASRGGTATIARPRQRARSLPRVPKKPVYQQIPQLQPSEPDLSLQADEPPLPAALPARSNQTSRGQRLLAAAGIGMVIVIGTAIVVMSAWLLTLAP